MLRRLRCWLRGHEPIVRRVPPWGLDHECFRCGRALGTTTQVPSAALLTARLAERGRIARAQTAAARAATRWRHAALRPGSGRSRP